MVKNLPSVCIQFIFFYFTLIQMSERDFHVHANTDSPISQDAPLLIPDDRVLDNMSQYEHLVVYQR